MAENNYLRGATISSEDDIPYVTCPFCSGKMYEDEIRSVWICEECDSRAQKDPVYDFDSN